MMMDIAARAVRTAVFHVRGFSFEALNPEKMSILRFYNGSRKSVVTLYREQWQCFDQDSRCLCGDALASILAISDDEVVPVSRTTRRLLSVGDN